ncbi:MAG: DUF3016 domain-containing protein [Burkholderiaceae bacterium]|nr:DUF3016 domain-containing protein [Burkholderiaceae bacterium]
MGAAYTDLKYSAWECSMKKTAVMLGLWCLAFGAWADVDVRFVSPDKFIDIGRDDAEQQQVLQGLEAHLKAAGDKRVSGSQRLLIEVLDVNLAGEERPIPSRAAMLRVLRGATPPSMQVRYTLSEGGVVLRSAESRLSDLGYQDGINRYHVSDSLRYEKAMVDGWFRSEFSLASTKTSP